MESVSIVFDTSFRYTSSCYTLYDWSVLTVYVNHINRIGLSASCSRFSKKFPGISQKVAQKLLKQQLKVAFCDKKVARKKQRVFGSDAKIYKLYNKSKISMHFLQFCGVTSVAE